MNIENQFKKFSSPNYFSRIDATHVLELHIGLDDKGRKAIELRAAFKPRKIKGTESIEVSQYSKSEYNTLRFSLSDEEVSGLFYTFCNDLVEQTRDLKDKNQGYQVIINRFYQWKKLFVSGSRQYLTEPEIMGLIGEILFLGDGLASRIGLENALHGWSGQELTHKDFSYEDNWYEVKAVSRGKTSVKISSLEQLESDKLGELSVYSLEKMSEAYNGVTLNKLVVETMKLFSSQEDKEDFLTKVSLHGYEYSNYYDSFVYEVSSLNRYQVKDEFPRLTRECVPKAITKVAYEISMLEIEEYRIQ